MSGPVLKVIKMHYLTYDSYNNLNVWLLLSFLFLKLSILTKIIQIRNGKSGT